MMQGTTKLAMCAALALVAFSLQGCESDQDKCTAFVDAHAEGQLSEVADMVKQECETRNCECIHDTM